MFDPSEISDASSKFALHVVLIDKNVTIKKIPLCKIDTDVKVSEDPYIDPIGDHHAYLADGILKVSTEFPKAITGKYPKDNIRLYKEMIGWKEAEGFQIVPIYHEVNWRGKIFRIPYGPKELVVYHPTWDKKDLDTLLRNKNTIMVRTMAQFIENEPYE